MEFISFVLFLLFLFTLYMLIRNHWIFALRRDLLKEESDYTQKRIELHLGFDGFRRLDAGSSYDRMFLEFWKTPARLRREAGRLEDFYDDDVGEIELERES